MKFSLSAENQIQAKSYSTSFRHFNALESIFIKSNGNDSCIMSKRNEFEEGKCRNWNGESLSILCWYLHLQLNIQLSAVCHEIFVLFTTTRAFCEGLLTSAKEANCLLLPTSAHFCLLLPTFFCLLRKFNKLVENSQVTGSSLSRRLFLSCFFTEPSVFCYFFMFTSIFASTHDYFDMIMHQKCCANRFSTVIWTA